MKYRLRLDLIYPEGATQQHLEQARDLLAPIFQNSIVINEGQENEERGYVLLERCFHDEEPPQPCETIELWRTGLGQVI